MKLRLFYVLVLFFSVLQLSWSQQKVTVTGSVKDENGVPLLGVSVSVKGKKTGTTTDFDGKYTIKVETEQNLVFSYVGMKTEERKIKVNTKSINVVLFYETQTLDDVVVLGYGSAKKITSTTGAVSKISAKEISQNPVSNVMDALQGKVAGLSVNSVSGEPGTSPVVLLHGIGTLSDVKPEQAINSSPLYIIDGVPVDASVLVNLNSDDFESVTVLKDASATSIYGTRAAYGVIYITTKKGVFEQDAEVSVNTQIGFSTLASRRFFENLMTPKEYVDFGVDIGQITPEQADGILEMFPHTTRWDKVYHRPSSLTSKTNISVLGGGKKISYYMSIGQYKQGGTQHGSEFERYSLNANIDAKVNNWFSAGVNLSTGYGISTSNGGLGYSGEGSGVLALPFYASKDENGNRLNLIPTLTGSFIYHPEYLAEKLLSKRRYIDFVPSVYMQIEPVENLRFKSQLGVQYSIASAKSTISPLFEGAQEGSVSKSYSESVHKTITNTLEYHFNLGKKHNFTALLGQESVGLENEGTSASSAGQLTEHLLNLDQGKKNIRIGENKEVRTFNSYFSRLDYNYLAKYFLDISARRDGSSTFGSNNRYANFWAIGAMWNIKNELFLENVQWINDLRFRFSVGTSGSTGSGGAYSSLTLVDFGRYKDAPTYFSSSTLGNPNLRWEKQLKTTIGFNFSAFNRFRLSIDWYQRLIADMFFLENLATTTGFDLFPTNLAKLRNRGFDVNVSVVVFKDIKQNAHITPYLNFNYNSQKVLEVSLPTGRVLPNTPFGAGYQKGSTLNYFAPIFKGVNPENGDAQWYLPSDNPMLTQTDDEKVTNQYDFITLNQNTGKPIFAPWNGGFGLNAGYKSFTFDMGFSFSYGKYQVNTDRAITETSYFGALNHSKEAMDYWRKKGDVSRNPRKELQFVREDSRLIEDASFIRLRSVSLGYSLPKNVVEKIRFFKQVKMYASARNLLTFTKFTGADPEFSITLANGGYPSSRQYVFGMDFKF